MIPAFPKVWTLETRQTEGIFDGPVEITEQLWKRIDE